MSKPKKSNLRRYGRYAGSMKSVVEDTTRCIETVYDGLYLIHSRQCKRKRGYGPKGLYCKQHNPDRIAKAREEKHKKWLNERKRNAEHQRRVQKALKLVKGIPTSKIHKYKIILK